MEGLDESACLTEREGWMEQISVWAVRMPTDSCARAGGKSGSELC